MNKSRLFFYLVAILALASCVQSKDAPSYSTPNIFALSPEDLDKNIRKANSGDVNSMLRLRLYYDLTLNDYPNATKWLEKAVMSGDTSSEYDLAMEYATHPPKDCTRATYWMTQAAENGDHAAIEVLKDKTSSDCNW